MMVVHIMAGLYKFVYMCRADLSVVCGEAH